MRGYLQEASEKRERQLAKEKNEYGEATLGALLAQGKIQEKREQTKKRHCGPVRDTVQQDGRKWTCRNCKGENLFTAVSCYKCSLVPGRLLGADNSEQKSTKEATGVERPITGTGRRKARGGQARHPPPFK